MKRLALVLCLLALPSAAVADGDYRWELTPAISYHFGGDFNSEVNGPLDGDLELDNGPAYGITFDVPLSNNLQLEFLLNYQESDIFFDGGIFGPDIANWRAHDPASLVAELSPGELALYLDCGTEDIFKLDNGARYLHDLLDAKKIAHTFYIGPGKHDFSFWTPRLPETFKFLAANVSAR